MALLLQHIKKQITWVILTQRKSYSRQLPWSAAQSSCFRSTHIVLCLCLSAPLPDCEGPRPAATACGDTDANFSGVTNSSITGTLNFNKYK